MFCSKCGSQLPEGANVCPQCGEKVEKEINFSDVTNYAGQKAQQVSGNIQSQVQNIRQTQEEQKASRAVHDIKDMFVSADEEQKAVIGGGYLSNMLKTGILGKGFGVLTNRRLYYRGKCFYKIGSRYMKTDEDCTVDLQDITSSGFRYTGRLWILFLAVLVLLFALNIGIVIYGLGSAYRHFDSSSATISLLIGGAFFLVVFLVGVGLVFAYCYFKISIYTVTFAGGSLSIKASAYGIREVRAFDKALRQAKDEHLAGMQ